MSQNKRTVERYMDAYARWDHEAVLACIADDIEWVIPGAFSIAGKVAFDREIEGQSSGRPPSITIERLTEEADVVVAEGTVRAPRIDGSDLHLAFCDVFDMRDGAIRRLTSYLVPLPAPEATISEQKADVR